MGAVKTKIASTLHDAIKCNDVEKVKTILSKYPESVNSPLGNGQTTALGRSAYLGNIDMAQLLIKFEADVNFPCKKNGNTPLMWAAWRDKVPMVDFLLDLQADIHILNHQGDNVLDVSIKRMSYQGALIFKKLGLTPKDPDYYKDDLATEFDYELFIQGVNEKRELESTSIFFDKIKKEDEEYRKKDLVIDPRETWKGWFKRTATFEEPPLVAREELPLEKQPHKSVFTKVENMLNGYNPYPPGHKYNKKGKNTPIANDNSYSPQAEKYRVETLENASHHEEEKKYSLDLEELSINKENDNVYKFDKQVFSPSKVSKSIITPDKFMIPNSLEPAQYSNKVVTASSSNNI